MDKSKQEQVNTSLAKQFLAKHGVTLTAEPKFSKTDVIEKYEIKSVTCLNGIEEGETKPNNQHSQTVPYYPKLSRDSKMFKRKLPAGFDQSKYFTD